MAENTSRKLTDPFIFRSACPVCEHVNPAESRYCNACGAPLNLAPCRHCGAMNDLIMATCYMCGGDVRGPRPERLDARPSVPESFARHSAPASGDSRRSEPGPPAAAGRVADKPTAPVGDTESMLRELRQMMTPPVPGGATAPATTAGIDHAEGTGSPTAQVADAGSSAVRAAPAVGPRKGNNGVFLGAMFLAILAMAGYLALRQPPTADSPSTPASGGDTAGRAGPTLGGAIVGVEPASVPDRAPIASTSSGAEAPATAHGGPLGLEADGKAQAAGNENGAGGESKTPRRETKGPAPSDAVPLKKSPAAVAPRPAESREVAGTRPGTAAEADAAAVLLPRSQPPAAGTRIEPPPARVGPCTDALAALGLCTLEPAQPRE